MHFLSLAVTHLKLWSSSKSGITKKQATCHKKKKIKLSDERDEIKKQFKYTLCSSVVPTIQSRCTGMHK